MNVYLIQTKIYLIREAVSHNKLSLPPGNPPSPSAQMIKEPYKRTPSVVS